MSFSFEKLLVYQRSLDFIDTVTRELSAARTIAGLRDQLQRAALSVSLNIAEGNGRWHHGEKKQLFWFARGSVFECVAVIQVMKRQNILSEETYDHAYAQLVELAKLLSGLIKSVEKIHRES